MDDVTLKLLPEWSFVAGAHATSWPVAESLLAGWKREAAGISDLAYSVLAPYTWAQDGSMLHSESVGMPAVESRMVGVWELVFGSCIHVVSRGQHVVPVGVFERWRNWEVDSWVTLNSRSCPKTWPVGPHCSGLDQMAWIH
ncbi:hypothetical protein M409DRAFT_53794 [Zasmidium cellare ATCC 36951]|uniref:Uncharacterized protein n=1 Tax=Zasmidium cellare ATCC 36951 TaxID=1080233 RepID=A0A6A6CL19_ZASCE|nr:uncharacterized protein M409DRAFT_53794 [Zasmidium cellare ATCC 36951]KAF2167835.1 hypothetical protein M409DRAFT_53794 [Zasmidium cellare ATCC 36951]